MIVIISRVPLLNERYKKDPYLGLDTYDINTTQSDPQYKRKRRIMGV